VPSTGHPFRAKTASMAALRTSGEPTKARVGKEPETQRVIAPRASGLAAGNDPT
jgi:hypothetical protein